MGAIPARCRMSHSEATHARFIWERIAPGHCAGCAPDFTCWHNGSQTCAVARTRAFPDSAPRKVLCHANQPRPLALPSAQ